MSFGKFQGEVIAKWSRDPPLEARNMSLMADFSYIEPTRPPPCGRQPKAGASMEQAFLSSYGLWLARLLREIIEEPRWFMTLLVRTSRSHQIGLTTCFISRCAAIVPPTVWQKSCTSLSELLDPNGG